MLLICHEFLKEVALAIFCFVVAAIVFLYERKGE